MICQVCFVSSFFRNVGVQLILLCILGVEMHVKCTLSFATSVSSWLLLPNHCHHQKSLQAVNAGEGVEEREPSCTVRGDAN